jgi:hypothetical protein
LSFPEGKYKTGKVKSIKAVMNTRNQPAGNNIIHMDEGRIIIVTLFQVIATGQMVPIEPNLRQVR